MARTSSKKRTLRVMRRVAMVGLTAGCMTLSGTLLAKVPKIVTFAVSPEGTSAYLIAIGFSKVVTEHTPIQKVVLQPFSSASAWPTRMNTGEVNFSEHCGYEQIREAYRGTGPFKAVGPQRNLRNVATMYGLAWSVMAVDPNVKTLADLKGKRVFVQVSHTDHTTALKVMFKAVGLDFNKDIKIIPYRSPREAIQGLMAGRGDAIAFGLIPGLVQVKRSRGLHTLPVPLAIAKKVEAADPVWGATVVPAGRGPLAPKKAVPVLEIECGMAASAKTDADTVYDVVKAVYEHHDEWKGVHPLARQTTLKKALQIQVAPFHQGAIRFYKEKGIWTAAMAAKQKQLLSQK